MPAEPTTIERKTAWIDGSLVQQAKTVAAHDGCNIADVLERHLRAGLAADMKRVAGEIARPRRRKPATHHELGEAGA